MLQIETLYYIYAGVTGFLAGAMVGAIVMIMRGERHEDGICDPSEAAEP